MSKYRGALPQLGNSLFMTDGGPETTLIYHDGIELPAFGAFDLLKNAAGVSVLRGYFERYAKLARAYHLGLVLESPTWRANRDWGASLGYDAAKLAEANRRSIDLLEEVREALETPSSRMVISGNLGPRGDGYVPGRQMTALEAYEYHIPQIATFARTDADMVAAFTMNYVEEAVGIVRAAATYAMPVAISFTLETDGRLPSGEPLEAAVAQTDAATDAYAAYYMINCAHPTHFAHLLAGKQRWLDRLRGVRANASTRSHAELDSSTDLDAGDPHALGRQYRAIAEALPHLSVVGGCCGTDHRHVEEIVRCLTQNEAVA